MVAPINSVSTRAPKRAIRPCFWSRENDSAARPIREGNDQSDASGDRDERDLPSSDQSMNGVDDAAPAATGNSYAARTGSRTAPSRDSPSVSFTFDAFTTERRESLKMMPRYVAAITASTRTPNVPPIACEKK